MRIEYTAMPEWPPLAWLACCRSGEATIAVQHGPRVEVTPEWFAEAVWADEYAAAGFDRTDLVFGSGGRRRNGTVTFVSSGTAVDRLQTATRAGESWVSNSLPCLLAAVEGVPDPMFTGYYALFKSIIRGTNRYQREISTSAGPVRLVYFANLEWNGAVLREVEKPVPTRDFASFEKYRTFLQSTLRRLHENLSAVERRFPYRWLATISSGYDGLATAVLTKPHGLSEAISLIEARGGESDSGETPAAMLGISVSLIARDAWRQASRPEVPFIAADAKGEDVFLRGADAQLAGRALLTGHYGIAWDKNVEGLSGAFERKDQAGLSLTEYRLWAGFLHCPIPFFGARQVQDLMALSQKPEMKPWDVGGSYNRPIPRRIIETAGIPRGSFATRKRAGSVLLFHRDSFLCPSSLEDFLRWLGDQGEEWCRRGQVPHVPIAGRRTWRQRAAGVAAGGIQVLARAAGHRLRFLDAAGRRLALVANREPLFRYLFPWAMARAKERYSDVVTRARAARAREPGS
jgi:hypothetical protein